MEEEISDLSDNSIQGSPLLETGGWPQPAPPPSTVLEQMMPSRNPELLRKSEPQIRPMPSIGESVISSLTSTSQESKDLTPSPERQLKPRPMSALLPSQPSSIQEDEDTLPFEETKLVPQPRPKSMFGLSEVQGKIMSKDSYEDYRKTLNLNRADSVQVKRSSESEDSEDELLHDKEEKRVLARDRQKQEARLSVWRQSMMKFTGTQQQQPDFNTLETVPADNDSEDDLMDDIPLSILRAHGFPRDRKSTMHLNDRRDLDEVHTEPLKEDSKSIKEIRRDSMKDPTLNEPRVSRSFDFEPTKRPISNVFEDKNAPVARGLVAKIAREKELRKKRQLNGFENEDYRPQPAMSSAQSVQNMPIHMHPDQKQPITDLHNRMDVIIQMLANMNGGGGSAQSFVGFGSQQQPSLKSAPSIKSMNTINTSPGFSPAPMNINQGSVTPTFSNFSRPPSLFSRPMSMASQPHIQPQGPQPQVPQPQVPQPQVPGQGMHNGLTYGTQGMKQASLRPSRLRLVQQEEEEDDEEAMKKLIEQRNARKQRWAQKNI